MGSEEKIINRKKEVCFENPRHVLDNLADVILLNGNKLFCVLSCPIVLMFLLEICDKEQN